MIRVDNIMTVQIRPYEAGDLSAILTLWEAASRLAHPFLSDAFIAEERQNTEQIYLPYAETWVATADRKPLGFIALLANESGNTEVGGLFVDPAQHGKGAGQALMNHAKSVHGTLEVDVFKDNAIGRRFYHRYGFSPIAESTFERTGDAVIRMKCE
ncbi:GNAT family N-acetyltransferase [Ferrimonas pelagia]|uniref:GNAT family N-acetyltransferase n=1 Tax=Ferrimonas pelagia TaxID=1177826 RepID=A0ABP9FD04_9GAMM